MSGYAPLFDSIATGTLYGRWPDIGVWPIVLALADRHGQLDVTPHYLAGVTGLPVADVVACMNRFCQHDPYSRTKSENGARLKLIDEHRDWGWIVVNHGKYREKARLMARDAVRTESGADAERKRIERMSPEVPRSPPDSPSHTQTQTQTETKTKKESKTGGGSVRATRSAAHIPADFALTPERRAIAIAEHLDPERIFAKFMNHWTAASGANARKRDWDATWRNWCLNETDRQRGGAVVAVPKTPGGAPSWLTPEERAEFDAAMEVSRAN